MGASAAFLKAWRSVATRSVAALAKIELTARDGVGSATIYAATREVQTPAGTLTAQPARTWEELIVDGSIRMPGEFLTNDPSLCTAELTLTTRRFSLQPAGQGLLDALHSYRWDASTVVTIWLWEMSLTSFDDARQRFKGRVQTIDSNSGVITLHLRQRVDWNKPVSPIRVTRGNYPGAPEEAIGEPLPIIYGARLGPAARRPYAASYDTVQRTLELIRGGRAVSKGILVDTGRGGGGSNPPARILVAGHAIQQLGTNPPDRGTGLWFEGRDGRLHNLDPVLAAIFLADSDGAGFLLDDSTTAYYPVYPANEELVANNAKDPRHAMDFAKEFSYATLDYTALQRDLVLRLSTVTDEGTYTLVRGYCIYRGAGLIGLDFSFERTGVGGTITAIPSASDVSIVTVNPDPGFYPSVPWAFSECVLRVAFAGGGPAGIAHVFAMGLIVGYVPKQELIKAHKVVLGPPDPAVVNASRRIFPGLPESRYGPYGVVQVTPGITELRGQLYANHKGHKDDGSGTFTGSASALIERVPDIVAHLLATFAGEPLAAIERAASTFGSFIDARDFFKTWRGLDMKAALSVSENSDYGSVLTSIAHSFAAWIFISPSDDKWKIRPWKVDLPVTYPWKFSRWHLNGPLGPTIMYQADSEVLSGLRVLYGFDAHNGQFLWETSARNGSSSAGYLYRSIRDGSLTVVDSKSDRIDFTTPTTRAASLTPGAYPDGITLAQHVATQMRAVDPAVFIVGFGPVIIAGYNDALDFNDGAGKTAIIPEGDYGTMEALAAEAQTQMNAVSTNMVVAYSRATGKFTISRSSGTVTLLRNTGANRAQSAYPVLGFGMSANSGPGTSFEALQPTGERHFSIGSSVVFALRWRSGANTARSAAELLGFDRSEDLELLFPNGPDCHSGYAPKTRYEDLLASDTEVRWGSKRDPVIQNDAIQDTDTAIEVRNRILDLQRRSRPHVVMSTDFAPDLERGDVIEFDSDMDELRPWPVPDSSGSWADRGLVVIEIEQPIGPASVSTTVRAVPIGSFEELAVEGPPVPIELAMFGGWRDSTGTQDFYKIQKQAVGGGVLWAQNGVQIGSPTTGAGLTLTSGDVVPLADGGMIAIWHEPRFGGLNDLYAQKFNSDGIAIWNPTAGITVDPGASTPQQIRAVGDGFGGAVCVYAENSSGAMRLKAQRIDASGNLLWGAGTAITSGAATGSNAGDEFPRLFKVGSHFVVAWRKDEGGAGPFVYAQKLDLNGVIQWAAGGLRVNQAMNRFFENGADISSDSALLLAVVGTTTLFVARITPLGAIQWQSGTVITGTPQAFVQAELCADGTGGAFVAWLDRPLIAAPYTLKIRRVDRNGNVLWASPTSIHTAPTGHNTSNYSYVYMLPDGAGGCFVAFREAVTTNAKILVARIDDSGAVLWGPITIRTGTGFDHVRAVHDGVGGLYVAYAGPGADIRVQHVDAAGNALWDPLSGGFVLIANPSTTAHELRIATIGNRSSGYTAN